MQNEDLIRMVDREGFIEVFWKEYRRQTRESGATRMRDVFDYLNYEYLVHYGRLRYSDYNSFRNCRDRENR